MLLDGFWNEYTILLTTKVSAFADDAPVALRSDLCFRTMHTEDVGDNEA